MTKNDLHPIHEAENRLDAENAVDRFTSKDGAKHEKRVTCLAKDRAVLRAFCDFPAEPLRGLLAGSLSSIG